jgi:hypothetical protein
MLAFRGPGDLGTRIAVFDLPRRKLLVRVSNLRQIHYLLRLSGQEHGNDHTSITDWHSLATRHRPHEA